jgi:FkbM family methyltransferase
MPSSRRPGESFVHSTVDFVAARTSRLVPAESPLRPPLRRLRLRLSPRPTDPILRLVEEFARTSARPFFMQIGANDGDKGDYLDMYVRSAHWTGVLVEPIPYVFDALAARHGTNPRLTLVNAAIADHDGTAQIYFIPKDDEADIPMWYDALASFHRDVIAKHSPWIPDIEDRISSIDVPTLTFESLCAAHDIHKIDLVQIDTEGHDYEVIKLIDLEKHQPAILLYEHYHLQPHDRDACERHLERHGYGLVSNYFDTIAVRIDSADRRTQRLSRLLTRVRADADTPQTNGARQLRSSLNRGLRRFGFEVVPVSTGGEVTATVPDIRDLPFDVRFHGKDVLPPGAEEYLHSNNPRLQQLRHEYAGLGWSVCMHSRWRDDSVTGWLNLKYFRGDNIIMWHYRDEASVGTATDSDADAARPDRLLYFTYLRHVLDQPNGERLVELLGEDGAFGCWVYSYPDYPACSRDLLDSVNELLFLDKHLSVLKADKLRILDIGAGYGRLAHRVSQAVPGLSDYCCVDAVAESTFLCEYYTRFRNVVPPVRVAPLPDVPSLQPDDFDVALNVHSFSECQLEAVEWWMSQVARLRVPYLFIVPNEPAGFLTTEADSTRKDYLPVIEANGYRQLVDSPVIEDAAVRDVLGIEDRFCLFERR